MKQAQQCSVISGLCKDASAMKSVAVRSGVDESFRNLVVEVVKLCNVCVCVCIVCVEVN